jgi:hypothetical protein
MRRLFVIVPLWLLLTTLGLIGWNYIKQPPAVDLYLSDLQAQCDSLGTENSTLLERVKILEHHVYGAGF